MRDSSIKIHPLPQGNNAQPISTEIGQLSVDIYYTTTEIVIKAPIAGVKQEDINIALTDDVLTIKGTRNNSESIPEENYYTKECFWGNFSRSIVLPLEADTTKIAAEFAENVLEIRIPKNEGIERTKVIRIQS